MTKLEIRKKLLKLRDNIFHKEALSKSANQTVIKYITQNFYNPKIASFSSLKNEINTSSINNHFQVYLPIVHPFIKHGLWFAKDNQFYCKNKYRISEPVINSVSKILAPWELDIIIIPIVGFNNQKYRMGMGGGFYDYSLSFKKKIKFPATIGIAFDEQENNDIIIAAHDLQLDIIITPTRIL